MTRIQEWAKRVTSEMLAAYNEVNTPTVLPSYRARAAQAVLERETRNLVRQIDAESATNVGERWLDFTGHNFSECGREDCDLCANCGDAI